MLYLSGGDNVVKDSRAPRHSLTYCSTSRTCISVCEPCRLTNGGLVLRRVDAYNRCDWKRWPEIRAALSRWKCKGEGLACGSGEPMVSPCSLQPYCLTFPKPPFNLSVCRRASGPEEMWPLPFLLLRVLPLGLSTWLSWNYCFGECYMAIMCIRVGTALSSRAFAPLPCATFVVCYLVTSYFA
jgi:hypothetical protein